MDRLLPFRLGDLKEADVILHNRKQGRWGCPLLAFLFETLFTALFFLGTFPYVMTVWIGYEDHGQNPFHFTFSFLVAAN